MRWLEMLVVGVFVFDATNDPFQVALITFIRVLPLVVLGSVSGAIAERSNRKWLLVAGFAMMAAVSLSLGILMIMDRIEIWHIGVGTFLSGLFWSADFAVRRTLLGEIAGLERLSSAMALDSATILATRAFGPGLGGIILELMGLHGAFFLGTGFYALGAVLTVRLRHDPAPVSTTAFSLFTDLVDGLRYLRLQRNLMGLFLLTVGVNFFGFSYISMVPVIGKDVLGLSPFPVGMLMSSEAFGGLIGATGLALTGSQRLPYRTLLFGSVSFLFGVAAFALSCSFPLSLAILIGAGICFAGFTVMQGTISFSTSAPEMRSRVMGVMTVGIGLGLLGTLHIGWLAELFGAAPALLISAVAGLLVVSVLVLVWRPPLGPLTRRLR